MQSLTYDALYLRDLQLFNNKSNYPPSRPSPLHCRFTLLVWKNLWQFWTNLVECDANLKASDTDYNRVSGVPHIIDEVSNIDTRPQRIFLVSSIYQTKIGLNQ